MNQKAFETQQFAIKYYHKLLKTRHAIDNTHPYLTSVPFSSRNTTHMNRYQQCLKSKKLVNKLIQIHGQINESPNVSKVKSKKRKNIKLLKQQLGQTKSLISTFKQNQESNIVHQKNCQLIDRLIKIKSQYANSFSKERQQKLHAYTNILKKNNDELLIRQGFFQCYEEIKTRSRPQSGKNKKKNRKLSSAITRPQTAK